MIYLDHAATTAVYPQVVKKMMPYFHTLYYNPSGNYQEGTRIRETIENVRQELAASINCSAKELFFTSGGTESDNWAAAIAAAKRPGGHIITTQIEHHAVLHTCRFWEQQGHTVTYLPVGRNGIVDLEEVRRAIRPDTTLISVMYANNEVGTIQPVRAIGAIAREHGIWFHTDAVQAYGHLAIDTKREHIDMLSVSAHKFGGPKGVGFLYVGEGVTMHALLQGGAQERGLRAGTENVAGIVGMGEAAMLSQTQMEWEYEREYQMREYLRERILSEMDAVYLNGDPHRRLPGNLNICFEGVENQALMVLLEMHGICVSGGSACTSAQEGPSHVLIAMGLGQEQARSSIRITLGRDNTMEQMPYIVHCLKDCVSQLRNL